MLKPKPDRFSFETKDIDHVKAVVRKCPVMNVDMAFAGDQSAFYRMMHNPTAKSGEDFKEACGGDGIGVYSNKNKEDIVLSTPCCRICIEKQGTFWSVSVKTESPPDALDRLNALEKVAPRLGIKVGHSRKSISAVSYAEARKYFAT